MTRAEYDQRMQAMLLTFANEDIRRAVTRGNVLHVGAPSPSPLTPEPAGHGRPSRPRRA